MKMKIFRAYVPGSLDDPEEGTMNLEDSVNKFEDVHSVVKRFVIGSGQDWMIIVLFYEDKPYTDK